MTTQSQVKAKQVRLSHRVVYWVARAVIGVAARVPQWLGYRAAAWLGRLWFRLDKRRRRYALRFLRNAYPELSEREHLRLGSSATANLFMVPLDMARLTRLLARGGSLEEVVDYSRAPCLAEVKPPFLGLSAHLGSWEVGACAVAQRVGGAHGIARVSRNPLLNDWLLRNRANGGLIIHPRRGGFRDLARAVEGGSVGLQVVDQNQRLRGVFVPFFGELASTERAAASLALRRGYPIVIGTALRRGYRFRFDLIINGPFHLQRTGNKQEDLLAAVKRINQELERLIREGPDQYLWIHDRYRTQPKVGEVVAADEGDSSDE